MATYTGEDYIREQLESICIQLSSEDEIIICDDCSTDGTVQEIQKYIAEREKYNIIKLYLNEENLGFQNNFNKALSLAEAEYIFFADQDDIWCADKIQVMLSIMDEKKDCQLLCCDYEPFICSSDAPNPPSDWREKMSDDGTVEKIRLTPKSMYIGALGCCMCMRREFKEMISSYWFEGWAQDDRCWRMALCADGLYVIHRNLVRHRLHGNNTATYGKYHTIEKRVKLFEEMYQADLQMVNYLEKHRPGCRDKHIVVCNAEMLKMRIGLLEKNMWHNCILLIRYWKYYQKIKSYFVEIWLIVKAFLVE